MNWIFSGIEQEEAAATVRRLQLEAVVKYLIKHGHEANLPIVDTSKPDFLSALAKAFCMVLGSRKAARLQAKADKRKAKARRKTDAAAAAVGEANSAVLRLESYNELCGKLGKKATV